MITHASNSVAASIAPLLSVRRGAAAVEFYKTAFGATEVYRVEDPSGAVVSRLSVDGARVLGQRRVSRARQLQSGISRRRHSQDDPDGHGS